MAEQPDMLVVDRSDASQRAADEPNRIVAATDAGFEHGEFATAFLEKQAGERKHRFESTEFLVEALRSRRDRGLNPRSQILEVCVPDRRAIKAKTLIEAKQVRRSKQSRAQPVSLR